MQACLNDCIDNVLLLLTSIGGCCKLKTVRDMNNHEAFYKRVGEKIREKREERGLSQEGLAKAVGLKRPSMSNIENGRQNILLHTFRDIAEMLDTSTDALLPESAIRQSVTMPDLAGYSKEVREFLEAGIKTVEKGGKLDHGDTATKN